MYMSHNGYPDDRSVLVLDNWKGHKNADFIQACEDLNIILEYGVPYAPDIMMHEPCGGHAKWMMAKHGPEWRDLAFGIDRDGVMCSR